MQEPCLTFNDVVAYAHVQVQFYCQFNHPQEEECGKHITNQYEAAVFFEREIKTFLKDRDMI